MSPWENALQTDTRFYHISNGHFAYSHWNSRIEYPGTIQISDELVDLILRLFRRDPRHRLCLEEVWEHSWITEESVSA